MYSGQQCNPLLRGLGVDGRAAKAERDNKQSDAYCGSYCDPVSLDICGSPRYAVSAPGVVARDSDFKNLDCGEVRCGSIATTSRAGAAQ